MPETAAETKPSEMDPLALLGITKDDLLDRVIDRIASYADPGASAEDLAGMAASELRKKLSGEMTKAVDAVVEQHSQPAIRELLNSMTLNPTTPWGEKAGEPMTFAEYATKRAVNYMQEKVDHKGSPQAGSYSRDSGQTRLAWMIDQQLAEHIKKLTDAAFKDFNKQLAVGINETVRNQINATFAQYVRKVPA